MKHLHDFIHAETSCSMAKIKYTLLTTYIRPYTLEFTRIVFKGILV